MRATVILSAPRQELLPNGTSMFLSSDWLNDRCPNNTFDNYFITPIKMINFKAIAVISTLLVSVLR